MPKLTVLTCVYNCEKYIANCIESVLSQDFIDFEFIIIDDGSYDNTSKIISSYSSIDYRIKYIKKVNSGLTASLNFGINLSTSDYIIRIDADDIMIQGRILNTYNAILNTNADVVVNLTNYIDSNGLVLKNSKPLISIKNCLMKGYSPFAHSSVILNKKRLLLLGGYDEFFTKSQDYELWLRMLSNGYKFHIINSNFTSVRIHEDSLTSSEVDYYSFIAYIKFCCKGDILETKYINFIRDKDLIFKWINNSITFKFYQGYTKFRKSIINLRSVTNGINFFQDLFKVFFYLIPCIIYMSFPKYLLLLLFKKFKKI